VCRNPEKKRLHKEQIFGSYEVTSEAIRLAAFIAKNCQTSDKNWHSDKTP
jgi:hypothetical protein